MLSPDELVRDTRERLSRRSRLHTYQYIAEETGLCPRWIKTFAGRLYGKPHLRLVNTLRDWLIANGQ